jgi:GntR family transcriptional repressor for pyruvate dehydrogenase complex
MATSSKDRGEGQKSRVTAVLIAEIKNMIANGELAPGARLPAERDLAKQFQVNRASVRQVLKVLEMMGVLTQRVGDGTYLSTSAEAILNEPLDFLVLLDDLSHHELFETRLIVEPELAARAADRATTEDLQALRSAVTAMQDSSGTEARLAADMAFHDAVFRASGNRICQLLFKRIHRTVLTSMNHLSARVGIEQPLSYHKKIYAAIRAHDAEAARRLMREHILDARSLLTQEQTRNKKPD